MGFLRSSFSMIPRGVRSKFLLIHPIIFDNDTFSVPKQSISIPTGSLIPITYAIWTSHSFAMPLATMCFARYLAMYDALLSTLVQSLPEYDHPPCLALPPYVSMIFFLPVSPVSAFGHHLLNIPVEFMKICVLLSIHSPTVGLMTFLMIVSRSLSGFMFFLC